MTGHLLPGALIESSQYVSAGTDIIICLHGVSSERERPFLLLVAKEATNWH